MEPIKYFVIGRVYTDSAWNVLTEMTESFDEARLLYDEKVKSQLYKQVRIAQTIYG